MARLGKKQKMRQNINGKESLYVAVYKWQTTEFFNAYLNIYMTSR